MGIFNFSDIRFKRGDDGPLSKLEKTQFNTSTYRYPIDIANYDKGHYMVFYIREQEKTNYASNSTSDTAPDVTINGKLDEVTDKLKLKTNFGGELADKISAGTNQINSKVSGVLSGVSNQFSGKMGGVGNHINAGIKNVKGALGNLFGSKFGSFNPGSPKTAAIYGQSIKDIKDKSLFPRKTKFTKDAIALYMPDTLMFNYQQNYEQLNMGGELAGQILAAGSSIIDAVKEGDNSAVSTEGGIMAKTKDAIDKLRQSGAGDSALKSGSLALTANLADNFGATGQAAFAAFTGVVRNPLMEMIYRSPNFRTFQYDFMFYPRDEREALEVQRIIELFRFHQAPEILEDAKGFMVPPSEFEMKFYYAGKENPNIPKIGTCVMTTMDVNYAPNGWSAYEVPDEPTARMGSTGMPVAIQLTLQFQEITYLTKTDFKDNLDSVQGRSIGLG